MCERTLALVQRELQRGTSQRGIVRKVRNSGLRIEADTVRGIQRGDLTLAPAFARCPHCGGLVKTSKPCLKCQLENRFQPAGRRHTSSLSIAP